MVKNYDAKDTSVVIDGVYITGLGEDMVTGEKDEDLFSTSVGAQGDVVVSEINNSLGTVTVNVQPTSPQKNYLLGLSRRKQFFPLWVINKKLGERFGGTQARVQTAPSLERGAESADMEFTFKVFDYDVIVD